MTFTGGKVKYMSEFEWFIAVCDWEADYLEEPVPHDEVKCVWQAIICEMRYSKAVGK